jgi:hypothetical protein
VNGSSRKGYLGPGKNNGKILGLKNKSKTVQKNLTTRVFNFQLEHRFRGFELMSS